MPLLTRKALIAASIEATEGTDAIANAGTGGTNTHLLVSNPQVNIVADDIDRDIVKPHLSPLGSIVGAAYGELTFMTELRGKGAAVSAASPLRDNPLWVACGMSPTYAASGTSSVVYKKKSANAAASANATASLYAYLAGLLHVFTGCRGNVRINAESGRFGTLEWTLRGFFLKITTNDNSSGIFDQATPAGSYDAFSTKPPSVLGCTLSVHGVSSLVVQALSLDLQNDIQLRPSMIASNGYAGCVINDSNPQGSINPEAVLRATHDVWARWQAGTEGVITAQIGSSGSTNGIKINVPAAQYRKPSWADRNGIRTYDIPFSCNAASSAGDDEVEIHFS